MNQWLDKQIDRSYNKLTATIPLCTDMIGFGLSLYFTVYSELPK